MVSLKEEEVRALKVGDKVFYRETNGNLAGCLFDATVVEIYPRFILLECKTPDFNNYFKTTFAFTDCLGDFAGRKLYKCEDDAHYDT